jgi:hypothetical protein
MERVDGVEHLLVPRPRDMTPLPAPGHALARGDRIERFVPGAIDVLSTPGRIWQGMRTLARSSPDPPPKTGCPEHEIAILMTNTDTSSHTPLMRQ